MDILTSLPCQWICSKYRFKDDHEAMLSDVPACPSCDTTLEDTIDMCAIKWVNSLMRKTQKTDRASMKDLVSTTFTVLA